MWRTVRLYCRNGHYYRQIHNLGQFKCAQHAADFDARANQWPCCGKPRYNPGCVPADHNTHAFRYEEKHSVYGMPEPLLAKFRGGPGVVGNVVHRFDRDEHERLNPYRPNGYTLKKPRVKKRSFDGETPRPAQRARRQADVIPQSDSGEDDPFRSSGNPDALAADAGTGPSDPDFEQSGQTLGFRQGDGDDDDPISPPADSADDGTGTGILDSPSEPEFEQSDVRPQSDSSDDDSLIPNDDFSDNEGGEQPGKLGDPPTGPMSRLRSMFRRDDGKKTAEQPKDPPSEDVPETRRGISSWFNWGRKGTDAEQESLGRNEEEEERLRLERQALEEERKELEQDQRYAEEDREAIKVESARTGDLRRSYEEKFAESERLQKDLQEKQKEAETLQQLYEDKLSELQQDETKLTRRDAELTEIHEQIKARYGTVEALSEQIQQRRKDLEQLSREISSLELNENILLQNKEELTRELTKLKKKIPRAHDAIKELQGKYKRREAELEGQIREKQRELEALTRDLGTIETLRTTLAQVREEHKALEQQKGRHEADIERLSQQKEASDTSASQAKQRSDEQEREIISLKDKIKSLTGQHKAEIKRLSREKDASDTSASRAKQRSEEREREIISLKAEIDGLTGQYEADIERLSQQKEASDTSASQAKQRSDEQEREIISLKDKIKSLTGQHEAEIKRLSREKDAFDKKASRAKQRSDKQEREIISLKDEIDRLTDELKKGETDWQDKKQTFEDQIAQKTAEIEELKSKLVEKEAAVKDLEELLQDQGKIYETFHDLLDQEIVVDFIPTLVYLRGKKGYEKTLLTNLFDIFMDKEQGRFYTGKDDFETVIRNIIELFQLDPAESIKMGKKPFFKIWYDRYRGKIQGTWREKKQEPEP